MYVANTNDDEIKFVLNNLCEKARLELKLINGDKYIDKTLDDIKCISDDSKFLIKLKSTNEPVGVFGKIVYDNVACGIFFLTTDKLYQGNKITLLRETKKIITKWSNQYKVLLDYCYKQNETIIKWLKLLGFQQSQKHDYDDFQIYYKGDINEYKY